MDIRNNEKLKERLIGKFNFWNGSENIYVGKLIVALYRCDRKMFDDVIHHIKDVSHTDLEKIKQNIKQATRNDIFDLETYSYFITVLYEKNILVDATEYLKIIIDSSTINYSVFKAFFENSIITYEFLEWLLLPQFLVKFEISALWEDARMYEINDVYKRLYELNTPLEIIEMIMNRVPYLNYEVSQKYFNDIKNYYLIQTEKEHINDAILEVKPIIESTIKKSRRI